MSHNSINPLFRINIFQIIILLIFTTGAVLGITSDEGKLFTHTQTDISSNHLIPALICLIIFLITIIFGSIIPAPKLNFLIPSKNSSWQFLSALILVFIGINLLAYNIYRLEVYELILTNPGLIAFNITEKGGAVILFATMSSFYLGAAGLLDNTIRKFSKILIALMIILFTIGVILCTRRDLVIIAILWMNFLLVQRFGAMRSMFIGAPLLFFTLLIAMGLRGIDILNDPLSYFSSGEFEPMRFGLLLVERWTNSFPTHAPTDYLIPFTTDERVISQVNSFFSQMYFNNSSALGLPTVTYFATFLYFGPFATLVIYALHISFVKQAAWLYNRHISYVTSYIYVFGLVKLLLFIRNGELFESLIDSIVILIFWFFYICFSKNRFA